MLQRFARRKAEPSATDIPALTRGSLFKRQQHADGLPREAVESVPTLQA